MRLKKNGEAPVPFRHGQVFKQRFHRFLGQCRLRRLRLIVLCGLQVTIDRSVFDQVLRLKTELLDPESCRFFSSTALSFAAMFVYTNTYVSF